MNSESLILGALFAFIGIILIITLVNDKKAKAFDLYLSGIVFHSVSMFWLWQTIETFGEFSSSVSLAIFCLYVITGSLQFLLSFLLFKILRKRLNINPAFVISWLFLELVFPRLFPWGFGNFFISVKSFSAFAELVGASGLSFIILVLVVLVYNFLEELVYRKKTVSTLVVLVCTVASIFFIGNSLNKRVDTNLVTAKSSSALVVQGNIGLKEKFTAELKTINLQKYFDLSKNQNESDFIIWPETVVGDWVDFNNQTNYLEGQDPISGIELPLVYGGLGFTRSIEKPKAPNIYNAAILRSSEGSIEGVYGKKVLMPFGEYVPFSSIFPFLLDIVPMQAFSSGIWDEPFLIKTKVGELKAGILICYEDLVDSLSREVTKRGAQLLINLTNDAWYGDTVAPYQHDLLARYRAIENRRYLIRSTNTGYTTLTDPYGNIESSLPLFSATSEVFKFKLLNQQTFYTTWGNIPYYVILFVYLIGNLIVSRKTI